jgi:hypothetical protein
MIINNNIMNQKKYNSIEESNADDNNPLAKFSAKDKEYVIDKLKELKFNNNSNDALKVEKMNIKSRRYSLVGHLCSRTLWKENLDKFINEMNISHTYNNILTCPFDIEECDCSHSDVGQIIKETLNKMGCIFNDSVKVTNENGDYIEYYQYNIVRYLSNDLENYIEETLKKLKVYKNLKDRRDRKGNYYYYSFRYVIDNAEDIDWENLPVTDIIDNFVNDVNNSEINNGIVRLNYRLSDYSIMIEYSVKKQLSKKNVYIVSHSNNQCTIYFVDLKENDKGWELTEW